MTNVELNYFADYSSWRNGRVSTITLTNLELNHVSANWQDKFNRDNLHNFDPDYTKMAMTTITNDYSRFFNLVSQPNGLTYANISNEYGNYHDISSRLWSVIKDYSLTPSDRYNFFGGLMVGLLHEIESMDKKYQIIKKFYYLDSHYAKETESLMHGGMKAGKAFKKVLYLHGNKDFTDSEVAFIGELLGKVNLTKMVVYSADFTDIIDSEIWENIFHYSGNSGSCWRPDGGYEESTLIHNIGIHNKSAGAKLFFIQESDHTDMNRNQPYILIDSVKYYLCGRMWFSQVVGSNEIIYWNPYHAIRGLDSKEDLAGVYGLTQGGELSVNYMYVNSDLYYTKTDFTRDLYSRHLYGDYENNEDQKIEFYDGESMISTWCGIETLENYNDRTGDYDYDSGEEENEEEE